MRLNVGVFSAEKLFYTFDGQLFRLVDNAASAVIAVAGIAFGIFVGEARTHGLHHLVAYKVFRCDKFDSFFLTLVFAFDNFENCSVFFHNWLFIGG